MAGDSQNNASNAALQNVRVLDLSRVLAGPWASQILGDLGAEILKIEHPKRGDDTREWGPPFLEDGDEGQFSGYYLSCNRNKKSIAVDIAKKEGAELIRKLASECDIVLENFKVGGLKKYGLDYESLSKINPRLIYCSITGFGQDGPYAPRGGYDFLIQGMSGLMSITGQPDGEPNSGPLKVGIPVSDLVTGLYATISILAALSHRQNTNEGQHIDCSLLDTQVSLLANQAMNFIVGDKLPVRMGNGHPNVVPYRTFESKDGHIIVAVGNDGQYKALCNMLGREELAEDPRFINNAARLANRDELEAQLGQEIIKWQSTELIAKMSENGVPGGRINNLRDVFEDEQIIHRELKQSIPSENGTEIPMIRFPAVFSKSNPSYRNPPPHLGQHSKEVLTDILSLSENEFLELKDKGVIKDGASSTPLSKKASA